MTCHSQRLQVWLALTVTSVISLIAHATTYTLHTSAKDWVLAASSISLIISICSAIAHFIVFEPYVDQIAEGIVSSVVFLIWVASIAVMMRPDGDMAVGELGMILNSNLYFSSWGSLMCIVYILVHFLYKRAKSDTPNATTNALPDVPTKTLQWLGLFVSSVILMASASKIHNLVSCTSSDFSGMKFCRRTSFAIALGALGMLFSAIAMFLNQREVLQLPKIDAAISVLLSVCFIVGVGFITFDESPGVILGNIYFSTWITFLLVLSLAFHSIRDLRHESCHETTQTKEPTKSLEVPTEPKEPTKPLEGPVEP